MVHEHTLEVQSIIHAGLLLTEQLVTRLSWQFIGWLDTTLTCTGVLSSREHTRGHVYKEKSLAAFRARLRVVYNFGDGDCGAGEMHTRACEISRQRDAKLVPKLAPKIRGRNRAGLPKIRDYRQSQGVWIKRVHSKRKTLIGPFLDTCQQSGNSTQAAVNTRDNIDSNQFTKMADRLQAWQIARWIRRKVQNYIWFGWRLFVQSC